MITDQDTANIEQKVIDKTIMRHEDDATSVKAIVNELRIGAGTGPAQGGSDKVRIARDVIYIFKIPNDHVRQLLL